MIAADTFSTFFQFRITNPGGIDPADGIVFALRDSPQALGGTGGGEGYNGIGNSIAVKFDTYKHDGEINDNHVSVLTNGQLTEADAQTPYGVSNCHHPVNVTGCMANGHLWSVWIDFDGASIHVALADNSTTRPADLINAPMTIPLILTAGNAWVGFHCRHGRWLRKPRHNQLAEYYSTYNPTPVGNPQVLPASLVTPDAPDAIRSGLLTQRSSLLPERAVIAALLCLGIALRVANVSSVSSRSPDEKDLCPAGKGMVQRRRGRFASARERV